MIYYKIHICGICGLHELSGCGSLIVLLEKMIYHNFGQRRHNFRLFLLSMHEFENHLPYHFCVTISPEKCKTIPISNILLFKWWKIVFFLGAPKNFWRPKAPHLYFKLGIGKYDIYFFQIILGFCYSSVENIEQIFNTKILKLFSEL